MPDRGVRARGPRMLKHWHVIPGTSNAFTGAAATIIGGSLNLDGPFTVLRMLGEYIIIPIAAPVVGERGSIAIAIGVVSVDAVVVGSSAMPDPLTTDPDYPWLYWASHDFSYQSTSLDPASGTSTLRRAFDIKSMRKMKPKEALTVVTEFAPNSGTPELRIDVAVTRVLIGT